MADLALGDVAPLYDLVEQELGGAMASTLSDSALGELIEDNLIAGLYLGLAE